jgi:prephenate dehydrogenase
VFPRTLGIIGLGPVGGSIAWGATRRGVSRVIGWSPSTKDGAAAARAGAITEFAHDPASVCDRAEVVVFATPVAETSKLLLQHAEILIRRGVICTDVSGVKRPAVDTAGRLGLAGVFAGSHPLVDDASDGFAAADPDRLLGALVYVTPVADGHEAVDEVRDFWARSVGAHPVVVSADRHDELVAWTEHLPRAVMAALARALAAAGPAGVTVPPGVIDATRLVDADPAQWSAVLLANRERLLPVLEAFSSELNGARAALEAGELEPIRALIDTAAEWRRGQRP